MPADPGDSNGVADEEDRPLLRDGGVSSDHKIYQPKGGHSPFLLMLNFQSWNQSSYSKPSTLLDSVGRCKVSESADRKDFIS